MRRHSRLLAAGFTAMLALLMIFALLLAAGVLFYDGPLLSFGPGGLCIGAGPDAHAGRVALTSFSLGQRLAGALLVMLLTGSVGFILHQARALLRLYGAGVVFAAANVRRIKLIGFGLILNSIVPCLAHHLGLLAGISNDPGWFHPRDAVTLMFGGLAFAVAQVMEFGHAIERERDGFI